MKKGDFKKLKILLLISSIFLFLSFGLIFAGERKLEVEYPEIFGLRPTTIEQGLQVYGRYLFNFSVFIVGLILFISLVWGGIIYLTSRGNPARLKDAKERISSAFFGTILLLSSYLILTTINPQLAMFKIPELKKLTAPKVPLQEFKPEKQTQIFYEIPIGQMLENGIWKKEKREELKNLVEDFEKDLKNKEKIKIEVGGKEKKFDTISDLEKHLMVLTESCHCEDLKAFCREPRQLSLPEGCNGDPCDKVRKEMNVVVGKNKEIASSTLKEYRNKFEKIKNEFEDEGRKFRNLMDILEKCKQKELLTRGDYYKTVETIEEQGGRVELIKSYLPTKKDDPLVFYCSVGGTIYDYPLKIPQISTEELRPAEEIAPIEVQPLSCPVAIPIGSLIEEELTQMAVDLNTNLEELIYYIDKMASATVAMNDAVDQCNLSNCKAACNCIPNPLGILSSGIAPLCNQSIGSCVGEPCKTRGELKELPERIRIYEEQIFRLLEQIKYTLEETKDVLGETQVTPVGTQEASSFLLPESTVNILTVRRLVETCIDLEQHYFEKPKEEPFWAMVRCDLAIGQIGPDGNPILSCHPQDFFCCSNQSLKDAIKPFKSFVEVGSPVEEGSVVSHPPLTSVSPSLLCEEKFPHFSQYDDRWRNHPYTQECGTTIGQAGCGPTSMAMVLNYFGIQEDPPSVAKWAEKNGHRVCGSGTAHAFCCQKAKEAGLNCKVESNLANILKEIEKKEGQKGKLAIISGRGPPPYSKGGHYIVLTDVKEEWGEKFVYFNDPAGTYIGSYRKPPCGKVPADFFLRYGINFGCIIAKE